MESKGAQPDVVALAAADAADASSRGLADAAVATSRGRGRADAASRGRADADAVAASGRGRALADAVAAGASCGLSRTDAVAACRAGAGPDAGLRLLALRQIKRDRLGRRGPGARARIC